MRLVGLGCSGFCFARLQYKLAVVLTVSKLAIIVTMGRTLFKVDDSMTLASFLRLG
jgi:hypothetical protein